MTKSSNSNKSKQDLLEIYLTNKGGKITDNPIFKELIKAVEPKIKELLTANIDKNFWKIARYQIETGGKRLRPILTLLSSLICGGTIQNTVYPAAGIEIMHNSFLMIDDIIDNSVQRRNQKTQWANFGSSFTQCINFNYCGACFEAASRSKKPAQLTELFATTMKTVMEGEILDILFEQSDRKREPYLTKNRLGKISLDSYLQMITKKTAVLFQTCGETGAICGETPKKRIEALGKYGLNLGIAFQIRDDILDFYGTGKKFGRGIGEDIRQGKLSNILIVFALESLNSKSKTKIRTILNQQKITPAQIKQVIQLIDRTNARPRASELEKKYVQQAKQNLNQLPQNEWNEILEEIADFMITRDV